MYSGKVKKNMKYSELAKESDRKKETERDRNRGRERKIVEKQNSTQ